MHGRGQLLPHPLRDHEFPRHQRESDTVIEQRVAPGSEHDATSIDASHSLAVGDRSTFHARFDRNVVRHLRQFAPAQCPSADCARTTRGPRCSASPCRARKSARCRSASLTSTPGAHQAVNHRRGTRAARQPAPGHAPAPATAMCGYRETSICSAACGARSTAAPAYWTGSRTWRLRLRGRFPRHSRRRPR